MDGFVRPSQFRKRKISNDLGDSKHWMTLWMIIKFWDESFVIVSISSRSFSLRLTQLYRFRMVPVKWYCLRISSTFWIVGKSSINWQLSIAMLVYHKVCHIMLVHFPCLLVDPTPCTLLKKSLQSTLFSFKPSILPISIYIAHAHLHVSKHTVFSLWICI